MKKGVLVVLLVLVILPIVSAQEINIFGQNYSLILVAPVFFMAIMVLIFLIMLLKDNLSKLNPARIHINFPKHKQSKEEIMKREGVDFVSRYNALKLKISKITVKDYFTEIIQLIKDYLKSKYDIKQEFIFEEIPNIVKRASKSELELANRITTLKYSGVEITKNDIDYINRTIGSLLIPKVEEKVHKNNGLINSIKKLFTAKHNTKEHPKEYEIKQVPLILPKIPIPLAPVKHLIKQKPRLGFFGRIKKRKILRIINEGKNFINKNPIKAKRYYGQALLRYHKLKIREDKEITNKLHEFSREILKKYPKDKHFFDISKKIISLKHSGKSLSIDVLTSITTLRKMLRNEEMLAAIKLKEFSRKLELEKKKLETNVKEDKKHKLSMPILEAPIPPKEIIKPREIIEKKVEKVSNEELIKRRNEILELIDRATSSLKEDVKLTRYYYGQALFKYYKLPVKKDDISYARITKLHRAIVDKFNKENKERLNVKREEEEKLRLIKLEEDRKKIKEMKEKEHILELEKKNFERARSQELIKKAPEAHKHNSKHHKGFLSNLFGSKHTHASKFDDKIETIKSKENKIDRDIEILEKQLKRI